MSCTVLQITEVSSAHVQDTQPQTNNHALRKNHSSRWSQRFTGARSRQIKIIHVGLQNVKETQKLGENGKWHKQGTCTQYVQTASITVRQQIGCYGRQLPKQSTIYK